MHRLLVAGLILLGGGVAGAQSIVTGPRTPDPIAGCSYIRCALGVSPAWNGPDVVQGATQKRVARLGFFWPGDIRSVFAGNDSASHYASRAVRARRVGAVLTDVGAIVLGVATARLTRHNEFSGATAGLTLAGLAVLGTGIPFQFAADGHLSRAVWWHNANLAR